MTWHYLNTEPPILQSWKHHSKATSQATSISKFENNPICGNLHDSTSKFRGKAPHKTFQPFTTDHCPTGSRVDDGFIIGLLCIKNFCCGMHHKVISWWALSRANGCSERLCSSGDTGDIMFPTTLMETLRNILGPFMKTHQTILKTIRNNSPKTKCHVLFPVLIIDLRSVRKLIDNVKATAITVVFAILVAIALDLRDAREGLRIVLLCHERVASRIRRHRTFSLPMSWLATSSTCGICDAVCKASSTKSCRTRATLGVAGSHERLAFSTFSFSFVACQWPEASGFCLVSQTSSGLLVTHEASRKFLRLLTGCTDLIFELTDKAGIFVTIFQEHLKGNFFVHFFFSFLIHHCLILNLIDIICLEFGHHL